MVIDNFCSRRLLDARLGHIVFASIAGAFVVQRGIGVGRRKNQRRELQLGFGGRMRVVGTVVMIVVGSFGLDLCHF